MMINIDATYQEVAGFHGHSCPGLAMGFRMTKAALRVLLGSRSKDEELVAIVENDACGTDAVQYLSGCTFGKGNLIFKNYGKMVYTFYCRNSKKAIRISRKTDFKQKLNEKNLNQEEKIAIILRTPAEELFNINTVNIKPPAYARLFNSIKCEFCGEMVMETRIRKRNGKNACIPCSLRLKQ